MPVCAPSLWELVALLLGHADPLCAEIFARTAVPSEFHFQSYLATFLFTLLCEAPFYYCSMRARVPISRMAAIVVVANLLTHPVVYFGFPWVCARLGVSYAAMVLAAEMFAPGVEYEVTRRWSGVSRGRVAFWIILGNIASWSIGVYWNS